MSDLGGGARNLAVYWFRLMYYLFVFISACILGISVAVAVTIV